MKKSTLETYALAVCFLSLFCAVVSLSSAAFDVAKIASPSFTMDRDAFQRYQSNDAWATVADPWYLRRTTEGRIPSEGELTAHREVQFKQALATESHEGKVGLFRKLMVILLSAAVFWAHWRVARHARRAVA